MKKIASAALLMIALLGGALAQGLPGQAMVPLWYCQLSSSQLSAAVALSSCVSASFTGNGSGTTLTTSSVTGLIAAGQALSGSGVPAGTTIVSQLTGTPGGAGTYKTSAATTSSSASLTSGGIPAVGADAMTMQSATANVRWRDDGAAPTASTGNILASGNNPTLYPGGGLGMSNMQLIAATGSPEVDVEFFRAQGSH